MQTYIKCSPWTLLPKVSSLQQETAHPSDQAVNHTASLLANELRMKAQMCEESLRVGLEDTLILEKLLKRKVKWTFHHKIGIDISPKKKI